MRFFQYSFWLNVILLVFLLLCTTTSSALSLQCKREDCPAHGGHDALLSLMHRCLLERDQGGLQCPCVNGESDAGIDKGYVIIKDCRGEAQFLLIPSATITGIEDPVLYQAGTPNYFALAWQNRFLVGQALGHDLAPDRISLALNPLHRRSQNQLHIHIDCIDGQVRKALVDNANIIGPKWQRFPVLLKGHVYRAMRVAGDTMTVNPVMVLFADLQQQGAEVEVGQHSLLVTSLIASGKQAFIFLESNEDAAEELQDHACADVQ